MDGSDVMALSGSASYYHNRGGVSGPGSVSGGSGIPSGISAQTSYRSLSNTNTSFQSNIGGGSPSGTNFQIGNPSQNFSYDISMSVPPSVSPGDQVKKKRGRPRKYGPNGDNMSLRLSTASSTPSPGGSSRLRGRPRGSGWKQRLAPLGEWMNSTAGQAFTPHVLHVEVGEVCIHSLDVEVGEDIAEKVLSFGQQRPRALCIMSASGAVSVVTLRQPTASGGTLVYEGRFEILCLSGSYLVSETGGPRERDGGLSISVCSHDGQCIGGAIGGRLIASSPVQVVGCSFIYGSKAKEKTETTHTSSSKIDRNSASKSDRNLDDDKSLVPIITVPFQNAGPNSSTVAAWPPVIRSELRYPPTQRELKRE